MVRDVPVVVKALVCHMMAGLALLVVSTVLPHENIPLYAWVVGEGVLAAFAASLLGLPSWWLLFNVVLGPMVWWGQRLDISSGWYLGAFLLLASLFWTTFRTRVPLYLSGHSALEALAWRVPEQARVLDLGCGFGGLLVRLAAERPDCRLDGCEIAPLPALIARIRARGVQNAQLGLGDFWRTDFGPYDVVYAFLSPVPMASLWDKARQEMRPGSILISNTFHIPGAKPDEVIAIHDRPDSALYVWRM
jgi:SAM-dependent methyltransferase